MQKKGNYNLKYGNRLQEVRRSLGLTQDDVAEKLQCNARFISDLERNKSKGSIDTLINICNIYNITPTVILQDYLNVKSDKEITSALIGYENLEDSEKEAILLLIEYFNKIKKK